MAFLSEVSTQKLITTIIESQFVSVVDSNQRPTALSTGNLTLTTSSSREAYKLANTAQITGSISSLGLLRDVNGTIASASLYLSSLYLGGVGGTTSGQLTTDATATDIFWKGTRLNQAGGLTALNFISAFTVSTGSLNVSSITALTTNVSTTAFISSLNVNSIQFGDGTGWINFGPIQTTAISSIQENTNALYANTSFFGTASTVTALQMWGLLGNYNNTVLAETSTGTGTQEFLVFKGSSASDRIRMQTTGNIVFETGVSSRLWSNTTINTLSNAVPAMIINTSSNVGIQTANPGTTLDVAGTARALTFSSQQLFASSLTVPTAFVSSLTVSTLSSSNINTIALSSAQISISSLVTRDQNSANPFGVVYQKSTFLYYNNFIFSGTRQAFGQLLVLGLGTGSGGSFSTYTSNSITYSVHSYLTSGSFIVSAGNLYADVLIVGGGGGGGSASGGGGGAGGLVYLSNFLIPSGTYSLTIGGGGSGAAGGTQNAGTNGSNSTAFGYTGLGGGGGGKGEVAGRDGLSGGCGGGAGGQNGSGHGGLGTQAFLSALSPAGTNGSSSTSASGAGGGGMGGAGANPGGGIGLSFSITGISRFYAAGGGGGGFAQSGSGGSGIGGNGGQGNGPSGSSGSANTGSGGGGGAAGQGGGGSGGSGIVIIRYPPA